MDNIRTITVGRVTVRLLPQKEGPVFVSVPSKGAAVELAAEVMGVGPLARDLASALRQVTHEAPATEPTPLERAAVEKILDEAIDLIPRISEDDPIGPALEELVRKMRAIRPRVTG